ncbi:MAG: glycosyltransferase family 2 protein [Eubacteriales bacterium]
MKKVDLIVPCYNEKEVLPLFYKEVCDVIGRCPDYSFNFIFVNDGSRDKTLAVILDLSAKDERVKYISFSRNFGKEAAMLAGMKYSSADYIGILDADLQHSPELLIGMLAALEEDYDVAAARRIDRTGEGKVKSWFSGLFYKLSNRIIDIEIAHGAQDFRVMKRKVVEAVISLPEYSRFSKGIFTWVGFNTKWFEHVNRDRAAGTTTWSFFKLLRYAIDGIIGFSAVPLKISLLTGSVFSGFGILYALYIIIRTLVIGADVPGYPSIISAIFVIGGLILLSLGIIGEYLARIYMEVKGRPIFIIDETNITPK